MDFLLYVLAGASVGLAIGLTGVGGGSLMTPLLLQFGFPPHIAIGTDLWYATITKGGGVIFHKKHNTIRTRIVYLLAAGSIPASVITYVILRNYFTSPDAYTGLLLRSLGVMLIITSMVVYFKKRLQRHATKEPSGLQAWIKDHSSHLTVLSGVLLGAFVTLSSVGAGAFGAAILLLLYPLLPSIHVVGTDLAHAVLLTFVAGLAHLSLGNVDFVLLASLLVGSLPATYVGAKLGSRLPDDVIRPLLATVLLLLGIKYLVG